VADLFLVDTDILIDIGRGVQKAVNCLFLAEQQGQVAVSAVTQMELIIGCRNKNELTLLDTFLKRFQVIEINGKVTSMAIELLKRYRLSHGLLIADALIAATAMAYDAEFLSKNQQDYRFIKKLHLLPYPIPFD
jgi:predicted nucleic acid-binding protein